MQGGARLRQRSAPAFTQQLFIWAQALPIMVCWLWTIALGRPVLPDVQRMIAGASTGSGRRRRRSAPGRLEAGSGQTTTDCMFPIDAAPGDRISSATPAPSRIWDVRNAGHAGSSRMAGRLAARQANRATL